MLKQPTGHCTQAILLILANIINIYFLQYFKLTRILRLRENIEFELAEIIYVSYISGDPGESQPNEATRKDTAEDIGSSLESVVKQQDIATGEWCGKNHNEAAASSSIPKGDLQLPSICLQQRNTPPTKIPLAQAVDHSSLVEHVEKNINDFDIKTGVQQKVIALSTSEGQCEPTTSTVNRSPAQFGGNDYHKGEILSERLSIKSDNADYTSTSKSRHNSIAQVVSAPTSLFPQSNAGIEPHRHQLILMHNRRLQQHDKISSEGTRSGAPNDSRTVHYSDTKSSSVILSDHGGVKTMIWKDNRPSRRPEYQSVTLSTTRPTTMTVSEHSRHLLPPLPTNPQNHRPIVSPTAQQLTQRSAHFRNQILQHQQPPLPHLSAPPPQYRPLSASLGFARTGVNRGQQQQPQQLPSQLFCHKSADKDILLTATPSSVSMGSTLVYPAAPPMPSSSSNSSPCHHSKKSEETIDQLINADQAIRMSNAVDGLLSLRTVHAAAAAAAAAAASISSSPSSSSINTTNITNLLPSRPSSTPNVMTPPPHLNHHMSLSPGKRRSPINMERLWAGDRTQLPNHGHQSSGDVRVYYSLFLPVYNRVKLVVANLGWVDFDFYIQSSCTAPQPILTNFQLPKQNWAGSGMPKNNVNPAQVREHQPQKIKNIL